MRTKPTLSAAAVIASLVWLALTTSASALSVEIEVTTNSLVHGDHVFAISTDAVKEGTAFHITITTKTGSIPDDSSVYLAICMHTEHSSEVRGIKNQPQIALKKEEKVWTADFIATPELLNTPRLCFVFDELAHIIQHGKSIPMPSADMYEMKLGDFVDADRSAPDFYLHLFASYAYPEPPRLVVSVPIHLSRDFDVPIGGDQRLKGRVEEKGRKYFGHFQGQLCSGPNVFDGEIELEKPDNPWPEPYDTKAPFVCQPHFVLSTNSNVKSLLKRQAQAEKTEHEEAPKRPRQHYEGYLTNCKTNEIRCLWFLDDSPAVGMEMSLNFDDHTVNTVRDVYNWARQGGGVQKLSDAQVLSLKKIIGNLPASDKTADFNKSVLVATRIEGKVKVFQYDRRHAPAMIRRIYDIGGGYFYDGKDN